MVSELTPVKMPKGVLAKTQVLQNGNIIVQGNGFANIAGDLRNSTIDQESKDLLLEKLENIGGVDEEIAQAEATMAQINKKIRDSDLYSQKMRLKRYIKQLKAEKQDQRSQFRGNLEVLALRDVNLPKSSRNLLK